MRLVFASSNEVTGRLDQIDEASNDDRDMLAASDMPVSSYCQASSGRL
ncbi:hypothetical protein [Micromonospora echinofusca]